MEKPEAMHRRPLSSVQREIWFDQILHPDIPLYNIGGYVRIRGPVNPSMFEKALRRVIRENDALRTVIHAGDPLPTQEFPERAPFTLDFRDFSGDEHPEKKTTAWMERRFVQPFELYGKPLFEWALVKISETDYRWLIKYHHLIVDGWAISLVAQRAAEAYNLILSGEPGNGRRPSYMDFIEDDAAYLSSEKCAKHGRYWLDKFSDPPAPLISRRPAAEAREGAAHSRIAHLWLDRAFYNHLGAFARENRVSTFHVLLGALYCYFLRTTGVPELVIGLPILNRGSKAFKQTVGLFTSVSPARFRFGVDLSIASLIKLIGKALRRDYRNQRFPLGEIHKQHRIREQGRERLFDLSLSYMKNDYSNRFNGSPMETVSVHNGFERNALSMYVQEFRENGDVLVDFSYNLDAFTRGEIERLKPRIARILEEMVRRPETPVRDLPVMPEEEHRRVLHAFNDAGADYPGDNCIHRLFEAQAAKTPDAAAVVFEDHWLTYGELNERANRLGRYLRKLGVGPEVLVGICMERSIEMIVALLGVLKAGGAYVPLDPAYPGKRLAFMLNDAKAPVLLTKETSRDSLPGLDAAVVCLDGDWDSIAGESKNNIVSSVSPENLAYVIYTSGSTGRPKGVLIPHSNIVRLFSATEPWLRFDETDVWTLFHSLAFDFSVWELWGALIYGGRLIVIPHDVSRSPGDFYALLAKQGVTVLNQTPSAFYQLIRAEELAGVSDDLKLRLVIFGGEALNFRSLEPWFDRHGDKTPALVNMYGITETTVHVTYYPITSDDVEKPGSIVGRPIPDLESYILNDALHPAPPGVAGELYIGGAGLARGYLNRPELTRERFIEHPFSDEPGARLYRTGDLASYLPDGGIKYLGRIDNQVQIRGFRVELGEIESVLSRHERVREVVVIAREDRPGNKRLIAYLTPKKEERSPEPGELRGFSRASLPGWMIPAAFVILPVLPLTPNGKIDRGALPAPDLDLARKHAFVAPRNETEEVVAEIWKEVLDVEKVGVHDNFFEMGGDSLLLVSVHAELKDKLNLDFPIATLFQYTTIDSLSRRLIGDSMPRDVTWRNRLATGRTMNSIKQRQAMKRKRHDRSGRGARV